MVLLAFAECGGHSLPLPLVCTRHISEGLTSSYWLFVLTTYSFYFLGGTNDDAQKLIYKTFNQFDIS